MTNRYSSSIRFFRSTLVLATAFATLGVMTLPGLASAITPSQTAVTPITVGAEPYGVAVSPDGSSVWVANNGSGTVSRIATSNNAVSPITVGARPYSVAVSPDGSNVWVTNISDGTVSRIDTSNFEMSHHLCWIGVTLGSGSLVVQSSKIFAVIGAVLAHSVKRVHRDIYRVTN